MADQDTIPFKDALRRVLAELCEAFRQTPVPTINWWRVESRGANGLGFKTEPRRNPGVFAWRAIQVVEGLPSFLSLAEAAKQCPTIRQHVLCDGGGTPLPEGALGDPASWIWNTFFDVTWSAYLEEVGGPFFRSDAFERIYARLFGEVGAQRYVDWTIVTPLLGLSLEMDHMEIGSDFHLRQVAQEETERWINLDWPGGSQRSAFADFLLHHYLANAQCALEQRVRSPLYQAIAVYATGNAPQDRALSALQLTTGVYILPLFFEHRHPPTIGLPGGQSFAGRQSFEPRVFPERILASAEEWTFRNLYIRLGSSPNRQLCDLALRRYQTGLAKRIPEDQLIDYWIGLESLLSADDNQEITFRASLRLAALIGQTGDERMALYDEARGSYKTRSNIVHGAGKLKPDRIASMAAKTAEWLRLALLKLLQSDVPFRAEQLEKDLLAIGADP